MYESLSQSTRLRCVRVVLRFIVVLQNRAAHATQSTDVRQIARKPQPPIELRVLHFS
jgi:hypothetical protein